jgi:hypothetical protein
MITISTLAEPPELVPDVVEIAWRSVVLTRVPSSPPCSR